MRLERKTAVSNNQNDGQNKLNNNRKKTKKGQSDQSTVRGNVTPKHNRNSTTKPRVINEEVKKFQKGGKLSAKSFKEEFCKLISKKSREKSNSKAKKTMFNPLKKIISDKANNPQSNFPLLTEQTVLSLDIWNTSLHAACLLHYPAEDIFKTVRIDNSLLFRSNGSGDLPLHYACMDKVGVRPEVLDCLLFHHPCAVRQWNSDKCLPLHLCCMIGCPSQYALTCLLKLYPEAVMDQCEFPMNLITSDSSWENITKSGNKFFDSNSGKFRDISGNEDVETGWSPLHLAIISNAEPSVITAIIEADKRCVYLKTSKGRTALDCGITVMNSLPNNVTNSKATKNIMKSLNILKSFVNTSQLFQLT